MYVCMYIHIYIYVYIYESGPAAPARSRLYFGQQPQQQQQQQPVVTGNKNTIIESTRPQTPVLAFIAP